MRCAGIIVAGGSGHRFGGEPKQLRLLGGQPMVVRAAWALLRHPAVNQLIVAVPAGLEARYEAILEAHGLGRALVTAGGAERVDSVARGLAKVDGDIDVVAVHDAARPLVPLALMERLVETCERHGTALPALQATDTVKLSVAAPTEASDAPPTVGETLDRRQIWLAQTPQVFRRELLEEAFRRWREDGQPAVTDDAQLCERAGIDVTLVQGAAENFKITLQADLERAEGLLREQRGGGQPRTGIGYDVHRLVSGRPLILGGVTIEHDLGLAGHSDADVLAHAIGDALLGAGALGDLGKHFPPSDDRWAGADSLMLLGHIVALLAAKGYRPASVDSVVICERPKLAPHIGAMRQRLAAALGLDDELVSVKATTSEGLGFTGRGEGIAAQASAVVTPC